MWARCGREIFTEALLLTTDFFVHYLRIRRAKDISTVPNRRRKESFGAETIPLLVHRLLKSIRKYSGPA